MKGNGDHGENEEGDEEEEDNISGGGERQREHPFIVTEPGEVARGKKNGLDYLFHLYEQCREFLIQVQAIAKERGEKCPTKVYYTMPYHNNVTNFIFFLLFFTFFLIEFVVLSRHIYVYLSSESDSDLNPVRFLCCSVVYSSFTNRLNSTFLP